MDILGGGVGVFWVLLVGDTLFEIGERRGGGVDTMSSL